MEATTLGHIDFDTLAKYGLNRFSIDVQRAKDGAVRVTTHPIEFVAIIDEMQDLLPGSLENDSATAAMMQDGSLTFKGFHKDARPRLATLLRTGRDDYFGNILTPMYEDETRQRIAGDTAQAIMLQGVDPAELKLTMICGCGSCADKADIISQLRMQLGHIGTSKEVLVPGSCDRIQSGDFRAHFNEGVQAQFMNLLADAITERIPKITKMIRDAQRGLEIAMKFTSAH